MSSFNQTSPEARVPKINHVFKSVSGKTTVDRSDEQLAKVQATVLTAFAPPPPPPANVLSHMEDYGLKSQQDVLIPTTDVVRVSKDTLALLGNAVSYISQIRRTQFINSQWPYSDKVSCAR